MQKRVFEFLETYVTQFPNKNLLYAKEQTTWKAYTCNEVYNLSLQLAASLLKLGVDNNTNTVEGKTKIGIIANNRPEWVITDYAVQQCGAVLVPLYPTLSLHEMEYVLQEAEVKIMFVSDASLYKKLVSIKDKLPHLQHIYTYNTIENAENWQVLLQPYTEAQLQNIQTIKHSIQPTDLLTIIYTSGTTGNPKGVMLSHQNICSNVLNCMELFTFCDETGKALSFLPLNHIFERMVLNIYICKGISIYFAQGVETVGENLKEIQPDLFTSVPRLLEKVYEKIEERGSKLVGIKKKIFDWAMLLAENYKGHGQDSWWYNVQHKVADKLVFAKWREAIGGNVKAIILGSAASQIRLQKLFTCANIVIMEGYGLTETSPVVTVNQYEESGRQFGTIGLGIKNQEIKLAPDGEILCRGNHIMMGYYKQPQLTAETIIDGWFHTGDIATMVDEKFMKITDRKKELFKLSAGKYIAPQALENKIKESQYIEQIMVMGSNEKFVGALIVPNFTKLKEYFASKGVEIKNKVEAISHVDVLKLIRQELNNYNQLFSEHEHVKRFQLLAHEWTVDSGEMTPTLKLKRKVIMEKYQEIIGKIFSH